MVEPYESGAEKVGIVTKTLQSCRYGYQPRPSGGRLSQHIGRWLQCATSGRRGFEVGCHAHRLKSGVNGSTEHWARAVRSLKEGGFVPRQRLGPGSVRKN